MSTLTCPECGFSKELPSGAIPPGVKGVTCPRCRHRFPLTPEAPEPVTDTVPSPVEPVALPSVAKEPVDPEPTADDDLVDLSAAVPFDEPGVADEPTVGQQPQVEQAVLSIPLGPVAPPGQSVTITCPFCNNHQDVPCERVPQKTTTARCPQCRKSFPVEGKELVSTFCETTIGRPGPPRPMAEALKEMPSEHPVQVLSGGVKPQKPLRTRLSEPGELFRSSLMTMLSRLLTLVGINVTVLLVAIIGFYVFWSGAELIRGGLGYVTLSDLLIGAGMILYGIVVLSWLVGANAIAAVDEDQGAFRALLFGVQQLPRFFWLMIVLLFLVPSGYLVLVLPGLLLSAWFIFAPFVRADEELSAMEALLKSQAYFRARGQAVYLRVFLVLAILFVALLLLWFVPVLGALIFAALALYSLTFCSVLYDELRDVCRDIRFTCSDGEKVKWLGIGLGGYLLFVGLAFGLGGVNPLWEATAFVRNLPYVFEPKSTLEVDAKEYEAGSVITITYMVPERYPDTAWIGILPASIPHGQEVVNDQHDISYQFLGKRSKGVMMLRVPDTPGDYDVRLHDSDVNGREILSVTFAVIPAQTSE